MLQLHAECCASALYEIVFDTYTQCRVRLAWVSCFKDLGMAFEVDVAAASILGPLTVL